MANVEGLKRAVLAANAGIEEGMAKVSDVEQVRPRMVDALAALITALGEFPVVALEGYRQQITNYHASAAGSLEQGLTQFAVCADASDGNSLLIQATQAAAIAQNLHEETSPIVDALREDLDTLAGGAHLLRLIAEAIRHKVDMLGEANATVQASAHHASTAAMEYVRRTAP